MPHRIDIDSLHEEVFVLLNFCYASGTFASRHDLNPLEDEGVSYQYYLDWLKFLLSEKLISCGIRTRIILDFLKDEDSEIDLHKEDRNICQRHKVGTLSGETIRLTIREICNKVVHADSISPQVRDHESKPNCECWTGRLLLAGRKRNQKWKLDLDLAEFCLALEEFIDFVEGSYDWHRIYKYD